MRSFIMRTPRPAWLLVKGTDDWCRKRSVSRRLRLVKGYSPSDNRIIPAFDARNEARRNNRCIWRARSSFSISTSAFNSRR